MQRTSPESSLLSSWFLLITQKTTRIAQLPVGEPGDLPLAEWEQQKMGQIDRQTKSIEEKKMCQSTQEELLSYIRSRTIVIILRLHPESKMALGQNLPRPVLCSKKMTAVRGESPGRISKAFSLLECQQNEEMILRKEGGGDGENEISLT